MADRLPILVLNQISASGLSRLPAERYRVGKDVTDPAAILVRSADLHGMAIPASVRAIGRAGAGTNNIPVAALSRHIAPALQFVAALDRAAADLDQRVENGKKAFAGYELQGQTLGVIGLGKIGCLVADAAIKLGMNVLGFDPEITVDAAWSLPSQVKRAASVNEVLKGAQFVTVQSHHLGRAGGM